MVTITIPVIVDDAVLTDAEAWIEAAVSLPHPGPDAPVAEDKE